MYSFSKYQTYYDNLVKRNIIIMLYKSVLKKYIQTQNVLIRFIVIKFKVHLLHLKNTALNLNEIFQLGTLSASWSS